MIKNLFSFLVGFLFIDSFCLSQTNVRILLVPLNEKNIYIDSRIKKLLKNNSVSLDSAKNYILSLSLLKLKSRFPDYEFILTDSSASYKALTDSLQLSLQWNIARHNKIKNGSKFDKLLAANESDPENEYYGCIMSNERLKTLKDIMQKSDIKYALYINKFETKPYALSTRTAFVLHIEIFNADAKKIAGDKFSWPTPLSKKLPYGVLTYRLRMAFDEFCLKIAAF